MGWMGWDVSLTPPTTRAPLAVLKIVLRSLGIFPRHLCVHLTPRPVKDVLVAMGARLKSGGWLWVTMRNLILMLTRPLDLRNESEDARSHMENAWRTWSSLIYIDFLDLENAWKTHGKRLAYLIHFQFNFFYLTSNIDHLTLKLGAGYS